MKVKRLLASTLVASMVVSGVASLNVNNEISATTQKVAQDKVENIVSAKAAVKFTDYAVLQKNASAKSYMPESSGNADGPAKYAFNNNIDKVWHSNYGGGQGDGSISTSNSIWIQTGFDRQINLKYITILNRKELMNNQIKDYDIYVSTSEQVPSDDAAWGNPVLSGSLDDTYFGEKTITLNQATPAKWVRIVAKSISSESPNSYVCAAKIDFYEEGTVSKNYDLNDYASFYNLQSDTLSMSNQKEANDRWQIELKTKGTDSKWIPMGDSKKLGWIGEAWRYHAHGRLTVDGFRNQLDNAYAGRGIRWSAPEVGYYKFEQAKNANTRNFEAPLKLHTIIGNTDTVVHTYNNTKPSIAESYKMSKGDGFRLAGEGNGVLNYCDFEGSGKPATWKVVDVTKDVAREKVTSASNLLANQESQSKLESAKQNLAKVKDDLNAIIDTGSNAEVVAKIEALEKATNQFNNDKLFDLATKASTYKWTSATEQTVKAAIQTALDESATVLNDEQAKVVTLSRALNKATRLYVVDVLVDGVKSETLSFKEVYNKAKTTTISAPTAQNGKNFVGWYKKKGSTYLYEVKDTQKEKLDVVASNDVTYEAVYGTAPSVVNTEVGIEMQNSYVSQSGDTYSAKFVGKYFNLPEGAKDVEFGLKWGKDANQLTPVKFNSSANKHQQFSLTVNGLREGQSVTGQVYVKYTTSTGEKVEKTSDEVTLYI